jgi:hypothetical protein
MYAQNSEKVLTKMYNLTYILPLLLVSTQQPPIDTPILLAMHLLSVLVIFILFIAGLLFYRLSLWLGGYIPLRGVFQVPQRRRVLFWALALNALAVLCTVFAALNPSRSTNPQSTPLTMTILPVPAQTSAINLTANVDTVLRAEPRLEGQYLDTISQAETVQAHALSADAEWLYLSNSRNLSGWSQRSLFDISTDQLSNLPVMQP